MSEAPAGKPAGLSVFFPAYNDSGTIASMVIRAVQTASALTPDYEVIVVNDGSSRCDAGDYRRARAHLPARSRCPSSTKSRLRRSAANRLSIGDQRSDFLHRWRRAVRPVRAGSVMGAAVGRRRHGERLQDQPIGSAAPHRNRATLPPHRQNAVRFDGPRCRLRLSSDAPNASSSGSISKRTAA